MAGRPRSRPVRWSPTHTMTFPRTRAPTKSHRIGDLAQIEVSVDKRLDLLWHSDILSGSGRAIEALPLSDFRMFD